MVKLRTNSIPNSIPAKTINLSKITFSNNNLYKCVLFDKLDSIVEGQDYISLAWNKWLVATGSRILSLTLLSRRDKPEPNGTSVFRIWFCNFSPASTLIYPLKNWSKSQLLRNLYINSIFNRRVLEVKNYVHEWMSEQLNKGKGRSSELGWVMRVQVRLLWSSRRLKSEHCSSATKRYLEHNRCLNVH